MIPPWGTVQTARTSPDSSWLATVYPWLTANALELHDLPFSQENNANLQARATKTPPGADQLTRDARVAWWPWTLKWFCSPSNFLWYINFYWWLIASATGLDFTNLKDRETRGTHTADVQDKNRMERLEQTFLFCPSPLLQFSFNERVTVMAGWSCLSLPQKEGLKWPWTNLPVAPSSRLLKAHRGTGESAGCDFRDSSEDGEDDVCVFSSYMY